MSEDTLRTSIIPVNVTQGKRIFGFKMRNIIEGVIAAVIVGLLIRFIPFTVKVQIIVTIGLSGSVFVLNLLGLKGMSLSECFINLLVSKGSRQEYHLRSIRHAGKNRSITVAEGKTAVFNESIAEKAIRKAKAFIAEKTGQG